MARKGEESRLKAAIELLTNNETWDYLDRLSDVRRYAKLVLSGCEPEDARDRASAGEELPDNVTKKKEVVGLKRIQFLSQENEDLRKTLNEAVRMVQEMRPSVAHLDYGDMVKDWLKRFYSKFEV